MGDKEIVDRLVAAWTNPGRYPRFHFYAMSFIENNWPTLYWIIQDAVWSRRGGK